MRRDGRAEIEQNLNGAATAAAARAPASEQDRRGDGRRGEDEAPACETDGCRL
jgi:hypothetical protein